MPAIPRFPMWLLFCVFSMLLLIIAGVPTAYFTRTRARTIYVSVVTPCLFVIYVLLFVYLLWRPLRQVTAFYKDEYHATQEVHHEQQQSAQAGAPEAAATTFSSREQNHKSHIFHLKELYKLDESVDALLRARRRLDGDTPLLQGELQRLRTTRQLKQQAGQQAHKTVLEEAEAEEAELSVQLRASGTGMPPLYASHWSPPPMADGLGRSASVATDGSQRGPATAAAAPPRAGALPTVVSTADATSGGGRDQIPSSPPAKQGGEYGEDVDDDGMELKSMTTTTDAS